MRTILVLALASLAALAALPEPARADDARRLELAKQLVAQVHLVDAMESGLPLMAAQMRATLSAQGRIEGDADDFIKLYEEKVRIGLARYGDEMAEAYAGLLTEDELSGAIAFDDTPLGQKIIAVQPRILQASQVAMLALAKDAAQEAIAELERRKAQNAAPGKL